MATQETVVKDIRTTETTVKQNTGSYLIESSFAPPKVRARSIILTAKKLKPYTAMYTYFAGESVNRYVTGLNAVVITGGTGSFLGADTGIRFDNMTMRTVGNVSYDTIQHGEVITCTSGSAVVISDENIVHNGVTTRVLYVANVKGTISGTITGKSSNSTASVSSIITGTATTNSMGNFYAVLSLPGGTFLSGRNKVMLSDSMTNDPMSATTMADASYDCVGKEVTHTTHNTYSEQTVTTVTDYSTTTWYQERRPSSRE